MREQSLIIGRHENVFKRCNRKMEMKKIAEGKLRSFSISFGLRAGYELNAQEGDFQIAATAILDWMSSRIEAESSYLTGHLVEARTLYAWKDQNGMVRHGNEPGGVFMGHVNVLYNRKEKESSIIRQLNELAGVIAECLDQERVYVEYKKRAWILERSK